MPEYGAAMRSRVGRHLDPVLRDEVVPAAGAFDALHLPAAFAVVAAVATGPAQRPASPPPEFNWREYAALLLDVAAEIEHSLMVQYLFAAYSLGGEQVPAGLRPTVRAWQETILGVAKEEMGHLVTVQNLRTALGLPLHLDREDYPWGSDFYPFEFTLERLTLDSLATYVCAESPPHWHGEEADEITARATHEAGTVVNRVGALYDAIAQILGDRSRIPDSAFDASTVPNQASWDEWGRGYAAGARGKSQSLPGVPAPDLLIFEIPSRDAALAALAEIGEQGESPKPLTDDDPFDAGEDSHFVRFLTIYCALRSMKPQERRLVSRPIRSNPVAKQMGAPDASGWAHLFNLRYRMLLVSLAHSFELADLPGAGATVNARGALVNRTFGEMYNLRAIAGILVELDAGRRGRHKAGPPFEMPYTLALPRRERDRWVLHRNLLEGSAALIETLEGLPSPRGRDYLAALSEADALALEQVERMLGARRAPVAAGAGA